MAARPTTLTPSREKALSTNGGMSSSLWLETIILLVLSLLCIKFIFSSHHLSPSTFSFPNHYTATKFYFSSSLFLFSLVVTRSSCCCCCYFIPLHFPHSPRRTFTSHSALRLALHDADMVKEKNYVEIWVLMALLVPLWLFTQHPEHKVRNKPSPRQWNHLSLPIHLVAQFDLMTLVRALSLALSMAKHISSSYRSIDVDLVSFLRLLSMLVFHSLRIVYDEWHDETHKSDFVTHSQSIRQDMSADKRPDR